MYVLSAYLPSSGEMLRSELGVAKSTGFQESGTWLEGIPSCVSFNISLV